MSAAIVTSLALPHHSARSCGSGWMSGVSLLLAGFTAHWLACQLAARVVVAALVLLGSNALWLCDAGAKAIAETRASTAASPRISWIRHIGECPLRQGGGGDRIYR